MERENVPTGVIQVRISGPQEEVNLIKGRILQSLKDVVVNEAGPFTNKWDPGVRAYLTVKALAP